MPVRFVRLSSRNELWGTSNACFKEKARIVNTSITNLSQKKNPVRVYKNQSWFEFVKETLFGESFEDPIEG